MTDAPRPEKGDLEDPSRSTGAVETPEIDALRWELLLKDYDEVQAADRAYVQHLAALIGVVIVVASAVAVSLEQLSDEGQRVPGWAWPFVPLPMLGILALLVYLQAAARVRDRYAMRLEREIRRRVKADEGFPFPSLFLHRRAGWHGWMAPSAISFTLACMTILAVVSCLNVIALMVTRPDWVQWLAGIVELFTWLLLALVFCRSFFGGSTWSKAHTEAKKKIAREPRN